MSVAFGQEMSERTLVVRQGDNLWDLSEKEYGSPLMWWTFLNNNSNLQPFINSADGQWYCVIKTGDTLHTGIYDPSSYIPEEFTESTEKSLGNPDLVATLVFLALILLVILVYVVLRIGRERNANPVTAGKPQVPGGVTNEGTYGRLREIVQARYPGARMEIRNIRRSNLSGRFRVFYASAPHPRLWKFLHGNEPYSKVINVVNTPGYVGEVTVNGRELTISFLQACGNDTSESYMVQETDSVRVNEDGSESPLFTPDTTVAPKTEAITQRTMLPKENEIEVIMAEVAGMSEQFFVTQTAHKATTRFERRADGSIEIESILETFDPGRKKPEEKK